MPVKRMVAVGELSSTWLAVEYSQVQPLRNGIDVSLYALHKMLMMVSRQILYGRDICAAG